MPRSLASAFAIAERPFVLGRQGDGKVLHPTVSRAHVAITWSAEAGAHLVRDLDSHNGSVLDGVPLVYQTHIALGFTIFLVSPFTRMVHIWSGIASVAYLLRPYQLVRKR